MKLYPSLGDRAYHPAQAILWIHIRAMWVSEKFSRGFLLPIIVAIPHDFADVLGVHRGLNTPEIIAWTHKTTPGFTPAYLQWTTNVLDHLPWASRSISVVVQMKESTLLLTTSYYVLAASDSQPR